MDRQDLPSPPLKNHAECVGDCVCRDCGHRCADHHSFNSDFVGCVGAGQIRKSRINGKKVKHQPIAVCKCVGFDRRTVIDMIARQEAKAT
jgi:hypothetical protein